MMFDNIIPAEDEDNNNVILEVRAGITAQTFSWNLFFN